jgi:serine/threonine protein kinase
LRCQHELQSNGSVLLPLLGITQDLETLNYMIVMVKISLGSLRNNLLVFKYNPNDKFRHLSNISTQLETIHKLDLVHGDFHNGNLLCLGYCHGTVISDLGLCRPVNQPNKKNEIYGVLPYMAPEVYVENHIQKPLIYIVLELLCGR